MISCAKDQVYNAPLMFTAVAKFIRRLAGDIFGTQNICTKVLVKAPAEQRKQRKSIKLFGEMKRTG